MAQSDVFDLTCEWLTSPLGIDVRRPRLGWKLAGDSVRQIAYRLRVSSTPNTAAADLWDSGRVVSGNAIGIHYDGQTVGSRQRCWWDVTVETSAVRSTTSEPSWWETGLLSPTDFVAKWINTGREHHNWQAKVLAAPLLRKSFALPTGVRSARAYVCGLGYHELQVNGRRAGDRVLQPIVSQYDRRSRYVTYDITDLLQAGDNAIGVILGNGWYNAHTADVWHFDKAPWRDYPKLWLQADVTLDDGTTIRVISDATWKTASSAITFDGLRNGETYDAKQESSGWSTGVFDDSAWAHTVVVPGPGGVLSAQWGPACHVAETLLAVGRHELSPGVAVYDFGQNLTGHARIRVSGAAGQTVVLQYAERVAADGDIDVADVGRFIKSGDVQTDRFTPATDATETWEPRFTYHGFRYVRVAGLTPSAEVDIEARVVETELPPAGDYTASDDLLNKIHAATRRGFRGNFTGIPTDCPHREKNGWTGDAQLAAEAGLLNFRVGPAYHEWVETLVDAQRPSGQLPGIVPTSGWGFNWGSGPAWDAALLLIPWNVYLYTADDAMIRQHYGAMCRYMDFCASMANGHVLDFGLGDWLHVDKSRRPGVALTSTAYYFTFARLMVRFARLLNRPGDVDAFDALGRDIRVAFNARFHRGDGAYDNAGQTAQACVLYHGLAEESGIGRVVERLVDAVHAHDDRPDFGILGAQWVPRALADHGHTALAYRLLTQRAYPGWAWWIEQTGATTLYESWDGRSSRNHVMFGDIDAWMFHYVAGLRPDPQRPGFRHALVRPFFPDTLRSFDAWHETPGGRLRSTWQRDGTVVRLSVTVPPNGTASVMLPDGRAQDAGPGAHDFLIPV
ncbi:MAG TPA: family 78 glycoside hydrolase catalytic domain [Tepidisphaeraceae bacterium]|jgi:alpha-L-rhamnosidase